MSKKPAKRRLGKGLSAMLDTAKAAQPVATQMSPDTKAQPHTPHKPRKRRSECVKQNIIGRNADL